LTSLYEQLSQLKQQLAPFSTCKFCLKKCKNWFKKSPILTVII